MSTEPRDPEGATGPAVGSTRGAGLVVAAICLFLGAIAALEARHVSVAHGFPLEWPVVLASTTPRWLLLALALPFVLRLARHRPLAPIRGPGLALHLLLFALLSLAQAGVDAWTMGLASPVASYFPWALRIIRSWYNTMPTLVSMYAAVLVTAWGMAEASERQRRTLRASQLEAQLQAARLTALRAQVQPHFLFNTLNGIAALAGGPDPGRAVAAIERLGELLHASLGDDGRELVTVAEEIHLAERYLGLQAMRFGDRLRYRWTVAPPAESCLVPVLLLQPLVENAVVHGLDAGLDVLQVEITAVRIGPWLELRVENDGSGLDGDRHADASRGLGLAATRARLATRYGDQASLELEARAPGGVTARIRIPAAPPNLATVPEAS